MDRALGDQRLEVPAEAAAEIGDRPQRIGLQEFERTADVDVREPLRRQPAGGLEEQPVLEIGGELAPQNVPRSRYAPQTLRKTSQTSPSVQ